MFKSSTKRLVKTPARAQERLGAITAWDALVYSPGIEFPRILSSTVTRELLVGISGLALVLFVLGHLAGNFFLFRGAASYNSYAEHLHSLGILLWVARIGLIAALLVHVGLTVWFAIENRAARKTRYAVRVNAGESTIAKRTMIYTGLMLLAFAVIHLFDFTFGDKTGVNSVVPGMNSGESLGLYGVVWNAFADPVHPLFYILALCAVGLHFSNAVSTVWMTLGAVSESAKSRMRRTAKVMGALVALGFSSIPLYVLAVTYLTSPLH